MDPNNQPPNDSSDQPQQGSQHGAWPPPDAPAPHQPAAPGYETLPPPPTSTGGYQSPPTQHGGDPWAFDHDANQTSQGWGSQHVSPAVGGGVRYSSQVIHEPASRKPLVIFFILLGLVAVAGGGAAWWFLRDDTPKPDQIDDPELVSLEEYVDHVCVYFLQASADVSALEQDVEATMERMGDGLSLSKSELLRESQRLLYFMTDFFRDFTTEIWNLNEKYLVDNPDGMEYRLAGRESFAPVFREIQQLEDEISELSVDMTDREIGLEVERIARKAEGFFDTSGEDPVGLEAEIDAEIDRRGGDCAMGD